MFYRQEENARNEEAKTDAILDGKETKDEEENAAQQQQPAKTQEKFIEETVSKRQYFLCYFQCFKRALGLLWNFLKPL